MRSCLLLQRVPEQASFRFLSVHKMRRPLRPSRLIRHIPDKNAAQAQHAPDSITQHRLLHSTIRYRNGLHRFHLNPPCGEALLGMVPGKPSVRVQKRPSDTLFRHKMHRDSPQKAAKWNTHLRAFRRHAPQLVKEDPYIRANGTQALWLQRKYNVPAFWRFHQKRSQAANWSLCCTACRGRRCAAYCWVRA